MPEIPSLHPKLQRWLLDGPLATYVPAYLERLEHGRYAPSTNQRCLNAVAHFAHWMSLCRLPVAKLDESRTDQFLQEHLPQCGCQAPVVRHPREAHAALMPLLAILRQQGVIADLPMASGPIAEELHRYDAHMLDTRGLARGPRSIRLRIIERLLVNKFTGHSLDLRKLQASDIRHFIVGQMELRNTVSNAVTINVALRDYLRWRATCGDPVQSMLGVIGSPANWPQASLPRALQPDQVSRVLDSFNATLRSPRRGYAVIRLALDLGLRCIEINRLQLDDIDWQNGTLTLRRTKSRRQDVLPLPVVTGEALEDYLRHERPLTSNRSLFVRSTAPHDAPVSGPLTVEVMAAWARQAKGGRGDRSTAARALRLLRPFSRWLLQFEPATEVPEEATFGPIPGRMAPHIFRDDEIEALLEAAGQMRPMLRGTVMQTLFGLIGRTGLRISEAIGLADADVDLNAGVLTIRCSKFGKSRLVPLHPSVVAALRIYRRERTKYVPADSDGPFFIATRGRRLGQSLSDRQAHRVFDQLRQKLGWVSRGSHGAARIHDLRHSFAVRRLLRWYEQGESVHQHMLALSTYMGHAKVSNTYWYLTGVPELLQVVGGALRALHRPVGRRGE